MAVLEWVVISFSRGSSRPRDQTRVSCIVGGRFTVWATRGNLLLYLYWRRLLRVPWTARRSNQSILKEINPEYSLEGLMLKLKLQNFGTWCEELTHWKRPGCWERLKAGEGDDRGWDGWMASPTRWTWVWANSGSWWWTGRHGVLLSMGSLRDNWTELNWTNWTEHRPAEARGKWAGVHLVVTLGNTCSPLQVSAKIPGDAQGSWHHCE